jgi:hypothetical protein
VRGGAIPLLAWATLLLVLYVGNWIWDGHGVNPIQAGVATLVIYLIGVALILARREAIRRGPPAPRPEPEAVPELSVAAVVAGLSVACVLFGLVWSTFLVYFGAAVLLLALGRIAVELYEQRVTVARTRHDRGA